MKILWYICLLWNIFFQSYVLLSAADASINQSSVELQLSKAMNEIVPTEAFYAKNPLKINFEISGINHPLFDLVITALEKGNQLKINKNEPMIIENKKRLFSLLSEENVQFYLVLKVLDGQFIWKMYNVFTKSFIIGKAYKLKDNELLDLTRTVLIDIWEAIFGEGKTPFHCFLTYLETDRFENKQLSQIFFTHPLISGFSKKILTTKHGIIDLGKLPREEGGESLLFSLCKNGEVDILSLDASGALKTLIKSDTMAVSPSVNDEGLFYISGGRLYRFYFNQQMKKFVSHLLDSATNYVSVCAHPTEKKLLIAKNKKVYEVLYFCDEVTGELKIEKAYQISSQGGVMANAVYDGESIIASERIQGCYQLVLFENKMKTLLTLSDYHKQDPSISPCGTYVAYIAQTKTGERYVEIMNRFTGVVFRVTDTPGEYRFPVWVVR